MDTQWESQRLHPCGGEDSDEGDCLLPKARVSMLKGKAFKVGDDIATDHIIPGRLLHLRSNLPELAKHVLEDSDATFAQRVKEGDFVVGGNNSGLGSRREH